MRKKQWNTQHITEKRKMALQQRYSRGSTEEELRNSKGRRKEKLRKNKGRKEEELRKNNPQTYLPAEFTYRG